jgi:hypothetical protein
MIDIVVGLNLTSSRPQSSACLQYGTCLIYDNHDVNKAVTLYLLLLTNSCFCNFNILNISVLGIVGHLAQLVEALQVGRLQVDFPVVSVEFFSDLTFSNTLVLLLISAYNENEYWEYFLGCKTS